MVLWKWAGSAATEERAGYVSMGASVPSSTRPPDYGHATAASNGKRGKDTEADSETLMGYVPSCPQTVMDA